MELSWTRLYFKHLTYFLFGSGLNSMQIVILCYLMHKMYLLNALLQKKLVSVLCYLMHNVFFVVQCTILDCIVCK